MKRFLGLIAALLVLVCSTCVAAAADAPQGSLTIRGNVSDMTSSSHTVRPGEDASLYLPMIEGVPANGSLPSVSWAIGNAEGTVTDAYQYENGDWTSELITIPWSALTSDDNVITVTVQAGNGNQWASVTNGTAEGTDGAVFMYHVYRSGNGPWIDWAENQTEVEVAVGEEIVVTAWVYGINPDTGGFTAPDEATVTGCEWVCSEPDGAEAPAHVEIVHADTEGPTPQVTLKGLRPTEDEPYLLQLVAVVNGEQMKTGFLSISVTEGADPGKLEITTSASTLTSTLNTTLRGVSAHIFLPEITGTPAVQDGYPVMPTVVWEANGESREVLDAYRYESGVWRSIPLYIPAAALTDDTNTVTVRISAGPGNIWSSVVNGAGTGTAEAQYRYQVYTSDAPILDWADDTDYIERIGVGEELTLTAWTLSLDGDEVHVSAVPAEDCDWTLEAETEDSETAEFVEIVETTGDGTGSPSIVLRGRNASGSDPTMVYLTANVGGASLSTYSIAVYVTSNEQTDLIWADDTDPENSIGVGEELTLTAWTYSPNGEQHVGSVPAENCKWTVETEDGQTSDFVEIVKTTGDGTGSPSIVLRGYKDSNGQATTVYVTAEVEGVMLSVEPITVYVTSDGPQLVWSDDTYSGDFVTVGQQLELTAWTYDPTAEVSVGHLPATNCHWTVQTRDGEASDFVEIVETRGEDTGTVTIVLRGTKASGTQPTIVSLTAEVAGKTQSTKPLIVYTSSDVAGAEIIPGPDSGIWIEIIEDAKYAEGIKANSVGTRADAYLRALNCALPDTATLQILDAEGTAVPVDSVVGTGMQLQLINSTLNEVTDKAWIVIEGDVTGSGRIGLTQLVRMAQAVSGGSPLTGPYAIAGDFNGDGAITLTDLVQEAVLLRGRG